MVELHVQAAADAAEMHTALRAVANAVLGAEAGVGRRGLRSGWRQGWTHEWGKAVRSCRRRLKPELIGMSS